MTIFAFQDFKHGKYGHVGEVEPGFGWFEGRKPVPWVYHHSH